jgi:hypothetical protein
LPPHPADKAGKVPLARDWTRLPWRDFDELVKHYIEGNNPSVITGWRGSTGKVVVDTDDTDQEYWVSTHLPPTPWMVQTRRGWHRYYDHPGPDSMVRSAPRVVDGVKVCDVKGEGGQVVALGGVVAGFEYTPTRRWLVSDPLPVFDPTWFEPGEHAGVPGSAAAYSARRFTASDGLEALERAVAYAQAETTPIFASGSGMGDQTLFEVALKIRRGFPLIPPVHLPSSTDELARSVPDSDDSAPTFAVDPSEADDVALWILETYWNPRLTDSDDNACPWGVDRLKYKVAQAAKAHLGGKPEYWLFDDPRFRKIYADERAPWVQAVSDIGTAPANGGSSGVIGVGATEVGEARPGMVCESSDGETLGEESDGGGGSGVTGSGTTSSKAVGGRPDRAERMKAAVGVATDKRKTDPSVWEAPIPLEEDVPTPWPTGVLRGHLADYVSAVSASVQTPIDMAGMMCLAILSAVARGKLIVQVKPDYREQVCLFVAVGAESGERKSALRLLSRPVEDWESAAIEAANPALTEHQAYIDMTKGRIESLRKKLAKLLDDGGEGGDPEDAEQGQEERDEIHRRIQRCSVELKNMERSPPPSGRVTTEDITPEALADVMARAGGAVALITDEGGDVFRMMAGKYDSEPLLNIYLKGHTGDTFKRDRRTGGTQIIDRPCLTVGVLTQPDTLRTLTSRELQERGLVARFLFSLPSPKVGTRLDTSPPPIPEISKNIYGKMVTRLLNLRGFERGGAHTLSLSSEALTHFDEFYVSVEKRLADGGDLRQMRAWGGKLVGHIVRIAALLHLADCCDDETRGIRPAIPGETFHRATLLTEYLVTHARRAFGIMTETGEVNAARKALAWIRKQEARTFSTRELHRGINRNGKFCDVAEPALRVLEDHGYVRLAPKSGKGRPTEKYEVHPEVFKGI